MFIGPRATSPKGGTSKIYANLREKKTNFPALATTTTPTKKITPKQLENKVKEHWMRKKKSTQTFLFHS